MGKFDNLFSSVEIRGNKYRNRIINAPTLFAHSVLFLPEIKENVYRMVENRAKGGSGAVSTGEISVNAQEASCLFLERPIDFTKYEGDDFEAIKEYATRIKKHGAISYLEFCHEGSRSEAKPPYQPWGPDAYVREDCIEVKAMDKDMMEKVCKDYYNISKFARECGFDGILIHGGHGFNIQEFISPWTNHRTDEFGGSMENKARFPKMLIEAARKGIGEDKVIELRISAQDGVEGGLTIEDTVEFCKLIDGMVDIIHVSNGLKWAGNQTNTFSDFFDAHGVNVEYAAKIKQAVTKSYVAVIGGINSPEFAEEIIANKKADFIELGRQGFADPEFANKAKNGEEDKIRRCVRCFHCYPGFCEHKTDVPLWEKGLSKEEVAKIYSPASMGECAINPNSGFRHYEEQYKMPEEARDVLIIGGGVGGLQAAITAKERGHNITLAEKTDRLGGIINFTDIDADKKDLCNFKNLLIREVKEKDINVLLNTNADENFVLDMNADAIIIAVGAKTFVPKIPGIETAKQALEVYDDLEDIGEEVVIVGGGLVGCEVGLYLAAENKKVSIVEMNSMMAFETFGYYRNALLDEMDKRGITQYLGAKCMEIKKDGVCIIQEGEEKFIPCTTVVYSMGMTAKTEEAEQLAQACKDKKVFMVGDCVKPGKVGDSVRAGYLAALQIN
ncbi:oxidoreductase [Konateibacter massiliensis]|uniref:oxidoreductase n=1 Tax=Konateibacter massiliensis TaxID=2002841 RepID=UPI000C1616F6|nr:FAD-dependent oxidoreductase [Konateibacter massiliensis]